MNKLIQAIEKIRQRIPAFRRHSLKETPTRTIVIDPLLEALGWDVRDPDEVQLEYPTVDGKFVDYALKLNKKAVLLVEAKALDDPLADVKAITQVVGYSANDGIVWCILTNGLKWRVYRSVEKCAAPDKLMFEVSIDPDENEGMTIQQIANQMWRFSSEEMAKGTLDSLGEQTFTDCKVRKALQTLIAAPPRPLLNLLRKNVDDDSLSPLQIKNSLMRISGEAAFIETPMPSAEIAPPAHVEKPGRTEAAKKAWQTRKARKAEPIFDEKYHISGKPQEAIQLYRAIDRFCMGLAPGAVEKRYRSHYIGYFFQGESFCRIRLQRTQAIVRLRLKYSTVNNPPSFSRDTKGLLRQSPLDFELRISTRAELDESIPLIRQSFESQK